MDKRGQKGGSSDDARMLLQVCISCRFKANNEGVKFHLVSNFFKLCCLRFLAGVSSEYKHTGCLDEQLFDPKRHISGFTPNILTHNLPKH